LTAWAAIGDGVRITLDRLHPLSSAIPTGIQIDFPENATGEVGFQNFGENRLRSLDEEETDLS